MGALRVVRRAVVSVVEALLVVRKDRGVVGSLAGVGVVLVGGVGEELRGVLVLVLVLREWMS